MESNWKFDCGLLMLMVIVPILLPNTNSSFGIIATLIIGLILVMKILFTLRRITSEIDKQLKTAYQSPIQKNQMEYYQLGIKLIEDSQTIDILSNGTLLKSLKKAENANCFIVTTKNSIWNWNWRGRGNDNYYQIFLKSGDKFQELLRFKELTWEDTRDDFRLEEFDYLANEIAAKLKIKIKPAHNNGYK